MNIKKTLLAAVVAAFAFAALPGLAAADEVDYSNPHFTITGEETKLEAAGGNTVTCASVTGTGEFTDETGETGTIDLLFHGCKAFGTNCQSAGEPSGTIATTEELPFHIVRLTYETEDKSIDDTPGVLITPKTIETPEEKHHNHFATFKCAGGLVTVVVRGNGVIGHVTEGYNNAQETFTINFDTKADESGQEFTHYFDVHTNGEGGAEEHTTNGPYYLESSLNGGAFAAATQVGEGTLHTTEETTAEFTTTHTE